MEKAAPRMPVATLKPVVREPMPRSSVVAHTLKETKNPRLAATRRGKKRINHEKLHEKLLFFIIAGNGEKSRKIFEFPHRMKDNKKEVSFMEEKERDIFAEALVFLKAKRLAKYGYVAEGLWSVRIDDPDDKKVHKNSPAFCSGT